MSTLTKAGRYELREELGRGAMGVVYHAHDPVIGRDVAVKTMHLSEAGTGMSREELVGRFQTEARAAGLLTHPNIVVIFDAGEEEGLFYITMEMVEGRSLQTLLDAHQLFPLPRVMKLMEQVCSALDFAHQHNVVHRDVKPANLVLTTDDTVKITDFGTAKILQFGTAQTAHVMGTPSYMSPEQVKGKPVDGRSDIFSLGVILYELMTGEKPFPGQNITTVIYKIINEEPIPPRSLDSSIHPGLSTVITRALAKDPDQRFQNCHELLDALKNYHDLVSPEQTVRMSPVTAQSGLKSNRSGAPPHREAALAPAAVTRGAEAPAQLLPRPFEPPRPLEADTDLATKRGTLLLSLILLAIIGYSGHRIYPAMRDLWQRAHETGETSEPQSVPSSASPAAAPAMPEAVKPDIKPDSALPTPVAIPAIAPAVESNSAPPVPSQESVVPEAAPKAPAPAAVSAPVKIPGKPAALSAPAPSQVSPATAFESKLRSQLAGLPLVRKLKSQVNSNTLTLSGELTIAEHRELLAHLHAVPPGVRVIDDVENAADSSTAQATTAVPASSGWVWVRSEPGGANILVDGTDTGFRTPARVQIPQGEHAVRLQLQGFLTAQRAVLIQTGQTMQFTQALTPQ